MPLTKRFKETVKKRIQSDESFRTALFEEALQLLIEGNFDTGKAILRDTINATMGFEALGKTTNKSPKSLMRMVSQSGNPNARNLIDIITAIKDSFGVQITINATMP